jgi:hypothetical protein
MLRVSILLPSEDLQQTLPCQWIAAHGNGMATIRTACRKCHAKAGLCQADGPAPGSWRDHYYYAYTAGQ